MASMNDSRGDYESSLMESLEGRLDELLLLNALVALLLKSVSCRTQFCFLSSLYCMHLAFRF